MGAMSDKTNLPEYCFTVLKTTNEVVIVHRNTKGYSPTREGNQPWYGQETADLLNSERLGVTKAQSRAMEMGSMFGWDIPAADPSNYGEDGTYKK
jgi:hypothetical protein